MSKRPQVANGKLGAQFHSTKVWVGASQGPTVAKDPGGQSHIFITNYKQFKTFNTCTQPSHPCRPRSCRTQASHQWTHSPHKVNRQCWSRNPPKISSPLELGYRWHWDFHLFKSRRNTWKNEHYFHEMILVRLWTARSSKIVHFLAGLKVLLQRKCFKKCGIKC